MFFCYVVVTCAAPANVPDSSLTPNEASYYYADIITYTYDTGYDHSSGDLSRTCSSGSAWSGSPPVCTSMSLYHP